MYMLLNFRWTTREINSLRKEVNKLKATNEIVSQLCDAVLKAQASEANAKQAWEEANTALKALEAETELSEETRAKVAQILGNAVVVPPVSTEPISTAVDAAPSELL
jgi:hypothetical protein